DGAAALTALCWSSVVVVALFTLGLFTRVTGVLTWLVVGSFTANPAIASDVDALFLILAFYLMVGYLLLGQWRTGVSLPNRLFGSLDTLLLGRRGGESGPAPSVGANVAVRLLQVHFAVVIVGSGLPKLQVGGLWFGGAV